MHQMCGQKRHHTHLGYVGFGGTKKANQSRVGRGCVGGKGMQVGKLRGGLLADGKVRGTVSAQPWGGLPHGAESAQEPKRTWGQSPILPPFTWAGVEGALCGANASRLRHGRHVIPQDAPLALCASRSLSIWEWVAPASLCPRSGVGPTVALPLPGCVPRTQFSDSSGVSVSLSAGWCGV